MKLKIANKDGKTLSEVFGIPEERIDFLMKCLKEEVEKGQEPASDSEAIILAVSLAKNKTEAVILTYILSRAITKSVCLHDKNPFRP